jgi:hypothetical protein
MTDTRIAHAFSGLSDDQSLLALLSETLEMTRDLEMTQRALKEASGAKLQELIESAGLPEEIEGAAKTAQVTIVEILSRISEQDLQDGRDKGPLTPDDYTEALKAKRTLSLARGRSAEREDEREG